MPEENQSPENSGENQETRDEKGRFIKGISGNPEGKPKGTISVVSVIKQILKEKAKTTDGTEKERLETLARNIVAMAINNQDKDMIKLIVSHLDGMPRQALSLGLEDSIDAVEIILKNETSTKRRQEHNESIPEESEGVAGEEE